MTASLALRRGLCRRLVASRRHKASDFSTLVALDYEYPGLPSVSPEAAKVTSPSVTTLPSGLTIVTESSSTTSSVSMTYPKAGSSNEMIDEHGAAIINKGLTFMSGSGVSTRFIYRMIENNGGVPSIEVDRTKATVGFTVAPELMTEMVPLLALDCSFEKWDVRDAKKLAGVEAEEAAGSAQVVLTENLYAAAYGPQSPAGRTFYATDPSLDAIVAFRGRAYGMDGAVLAATGVADHSAFCTAVGEVLSGANAASEPAAPMTYLGGESRVAASAAGFAHVALGFPAPASSVMAAIVKQLFTVSGAEAGVSGFSGPGLVGVYAGSTDSAGLVDSMITVVKGAVTPEGIKRAKVLAKAEAVFAMDGGSKSLADCMAASIIESGSASGPADVAAAYDAVTDAQVKDAVAAMVKSNPALAAIGDISLVPYHATIAAQF